MIKAIKYSILVLCGLIWSTSQAQKAEAVLDTSAMLIGDQVPLHLKFTAPNGTELQWPYQKDTVTKKIEIIDQQAVDTVAFEGDSVQMKQKLIITSFDTGYLVIPPFSFQYELDGKAGVAKSDPLLLYVKPMAVDTTKSIKSIKGPMTAPLTFMDILPWLLIGLAILLLAALIWYVIWRKRQKKPVFPVKRKPRDPADVEALKAVDQLKKKKLWQSGEVKAFHSELSQILRVYLERRYAVPAIESTSADILSDMNNKGLDRKVYQLLTTFLELTDLVKFARMEPLPSENEGALQQAIRFIEQTRPVQDEAKANDAMKKGGSHVE